MRTLSALHPRQDGQALVSVLGALVLLTLVSWAFVALMNVEHRHVGKAYRSTSALYLAEAGIEKALWHLARSTGETGDGNGHPIGYAEQIGPGRFVVEQIEEPSPGLYLVTVSGEVGGAVRRIRRAARIAPKALGYSLFGGDLVLAGGARTYVVPLLRRQRESQRLGDLAAFKSVWFEAGTVFNTLDGRRLLGRDQGGLADFELFGLSVPPVHSTPPSETLPDLVLMSQAQLLFGARPWTLGDIGALKREVPTANARTLRKDEASFPTPDLDAYRALARANLANAALNRAIGERAMDRTLYEKIDSLYTHEQFGRILGYLDAVQRDRAGWANIALAGVVFVEGAITIARPLAIEEGALVINGSLRLAEGMRLSVRHGVKSRSLPGLIAAGSGGMIRLGQQATLVVDGLVYAATGLEVLQATVDVQGAVMVGQGFINDGGIVVVRYHPDVLQTVGMSRTRHTLLRPLAWQEIR